MDETEQVRRRLEKRARGFRPDRAMERLEELKRSDPAMFATLGPSRRMALGHYVSAREARRQLDELA